MISHYLLQNKFDYEDLIFTAKAFAKARGIAVIPESVYRWNIYPQPVRKSITNQRDDIKNLRDRRFAIDRVMEIIEEDTNPRMRERLQLKVLRHDARLYLNDIAAGRSRKITRELLSELQDLIRTVPLSRVRQTLISRTTIDGFHACG